MNLKDNQIRTQWLLALVQTVLFTNIINFLILYYQFSSLNDTDKGDLNTLERSMVMQDIILTINYIASISSVFAFLLWMSRAVYNAKIIKPEFPYTPSYAAVVWFIPILNLYKPLQIMKELFVARSLETSLSNNENTDIKDKNAFNPSVWWFFWILNLGVFIGLLTYINKYKMIDEFGFQPEVFTKRLIFRLFSNAATVIMAYYTIKLIKSYSNQGLPSTKDSLESHPK